jgi:hypothetical protein
MKLAKTRRICRKLICFLPLVFQQTLQPVAAGSIAHTTHNTVKKYEVLYRLAELARNANNLNSSDKTAPCKTKADLFETTRRYQAMQGENTRNSDNGVWVFKTNYVVN